MKISGKYSILKKLSETPSNIVYFAKDKKGGKELVVKVLKDNSESAILGFKREFSILHALNHPNIVKVFELGSFDGDEGETFYFTMEFVRGETFNSYFRLKGLSNFLVLFKEVLETLQYIHDKGFIHGDLKSNHIIVTPENGIKIVDFGFAQIKDQISKSDIGGTLDYIAPELLSGEFPDERSDIYSLGIIAYESIVGVTPFKGIDLNELIKSKFDTEIDKNVFITADIPDYLKGTVVKMTAREPLNRFKNVKEVLDYIKNEGTVVKRRTKVDKILNYPFVGRKKFVNYTRKIVSDRERENGGIIIYEGPEGIGKTAILKEFEYSFLGTDIDTYFINLQNYEENSVDWMINILKSAGSPVKDIETMIENGEFEFAGVEKYKFYDTIIEKLLHLSRDIKRLFIVDNIK
ncbi:MAG: protein kinase, partial [Proteobacteria bacterium]|nr:protein kinase [Pseudomonadota bacterium]